MTDSMMPIMLTSSIREEYYSDFHTNQFKFVLLKFVVNTFLSMFGAGFISIITSSRVGKVQLDEDIHAQKNQKLF